METSKPVFICSACGYYCAASWAEGILEDEFPALPYYTGVIQMAAARQFQLATLCLHPDGTAAYGYAELGDAKGTERSVTPAEAEALLSSARPIEEILPDQVLEEAALSIMAGLVTMNAWTYVDPEACPEEFVRIADALSHLSPASSFARFAAEEDSTLRGFQDFVMDILSEETPLGQVLEEAVYVDERTLFTPQELRAMIDATRP
jgi:hypothetical protein